QLAEEVGRLVLLEDPAHSQHGKKILRDIAQHLGRRYQQTRRVTPGTPAHRLLEQGLLQKASGVGLLDVIAALESEALVTVSDDLTAHLSQARLVVTTLPRPGESRLWRCLPAGAVVVETLSTN